MRKAQATDANLENIRHRVKLTVSCGLNRGQTKFVKKKDLFYREFTKGNKPTLQLVDRLCNEIPRSSCITDHRN